MVKRLFIVQFALQPVPDKEQEKVPVHVLCLYRLSNIHFNKEITGNHHRQDHQQERISIRN